MNYYLKMSRAIKVQVLRSKCEDVPGWKLIVALFFCCIAYTGYSQAERPFIVKGNRFYKQQDFNKAAEQYKKATEANEKSSEAQYNLGNTLYKLKKPDEAAAAYEGAFENAADRSLRAKAAYNKGVLLSRQTRLPESIQSYKDALKSDPEDNDARENLQKALNELKKQQQPPPPPKKK